MAVEHGNNTDLNESNDNVMKYFVNSVPFSPFKRYK